MIVSMDNTFLEQFYESVILPRYAKVVDFGKITWVGHGKVDLDAWAHHFQTNGKEYTLLYEDFPGGAYLGDGLSHEPVKLGDEVCIELKFSDTDHFQIENVLGWYTLFTEIER